MGRTLLSFKSRSGTHGLHVGIEVEWGKLTLCGAECESVEHVLWDCLAYSRATFMVKLEELLGERYADFE